MTLIWLTHLETSEQIGIVRARVAWLEQKPPKDGHAVAIHLDTGQEIRVMESLADVRQMLEGQGPK